MPKRERSSQYPKSTWNECIDFVQKASELSLSAVSYDEVAKKYGLSNPTAKSFSAKLSTCKQFGLITTSNGNTIHLTDTCKKILFPTGTSLHPLIKDCFCAPKIYSNLIEKYDGEALPSLPILANIFMNEFGVVHTVKDIAAKVFLESAEQLGFLKNGVLFFSDQESSANSVEEAPQEAEIAATNSSDISVASPAKDPPSDSDYITQKIPFESGKVAEFYIPIDATQDDLLLMRDMLDVLLKRKFKLSE